MSSGIGWGIKMLFIKIDQAAFSDMGPDGFALMRSSDSEAFLNVGRQDGHLAIPCHHFLCRCFFGLLPIDQLIET